MEDQPKESGGGPVRSPAAAGPGAGAASSGASKVSTGPLKNVRTGGVATDSPLSEVLGNLSEGKRPASIVACTWLPWKRSHTSKEFALRRRLSRHLNDRMSSA